MHISPETGWLPARIANLKGRLHVVAVKCDGTQLTEPFLELDLNKCSEHAYIPLDEAMRQQAAPTAHPAGFIFHMSRTGSTVAGVMLRATGDVAFVGEPLPVNDLFFRHDRDDDLLGEQLRFIIDWFVTALGGTRRVVFKFASWVSLHLDRFQQLYPTVPCSFMYREPIEVISAVVDNPPFMFRREGMRHRFRAAARDGSDFERRITNSLRDRVDYWRECTYVEFIAGFIGAVCEPPAAAYASARSILPVNYATFKQQVIAELAPAFGLEVDEHIRELMLEATRYNVKALKGPVAFESDSVTKRQAATPLMAELCDRYVQPSIDIFMGKP